MLNIKNIVDCFKDKYKNVFHSNEKNRIVGYEAKLIVKDNVSNKIYKSYSVPYFLRESIKYSIERNGKGKYLTASKTIRNC